MRPRTAFGFSLAVISSVFAWPHPPPQCEDNFVHVVEVPGKPGMQISYKETHICEEHARAWSGYVHLSANTTEDIQGGDRYDLHTSFWYFEARHT